MDAAAALKRKGAEAPEPWLLDGATVPATKIRRLDAEVPPVEPRVGVPPVGPSTGVFPPPQQAFGVEAARTSGDVAAPAMNATALLKRKGAEAPHPWLDVDGVPVPATKIRRLDAEVPSAEFSVGVPPQPLVVEAARMGGDVAPPSPAVGVPAPAVNEERAIVVYQPAEAARNLLHGPLHPGASLRVRPDWIYGLKGTMMQEANNLRALFEELASRDENLNLAMVPWAPAQAHSHVASGSRAAAAEMMDADQDGDGASMEVEHGMQAFQQLQLPAASYQPSPVTWSW